MDEDVNDITSHTVLLRREVNRSLNDGKITQQINEILARANTPSRIARGWSTIWSGDIVRPEGKASYKDNTTITYRVMLGIGCSKDWATLDKEFAAIVSVVMMAAKRSGWVISEIDGVTGAVDAVVDNGKGGEDDYVGYAEFAWSPNADSCFDHIYGREAQISMMQRAVDAALHSDWRNRFNTAFIGPPACGKTETLLALCRASDNPASVLRLDGTAMTQAGLTKYFDECEELPRIVIIEEIEKAEESVLRVLLGIADTRGEVRKITAREHIARDARVLMFVTVNDFERFESMLSGSIASRFPNQIWFPRPDRSLMAKILHRELTKVGGSQAWISPCLDYMDSIGSSDPRRAIALCLQGQNDWLNGKFVMMLDSLRKVERGENAVK